MNEEDILKEMMKGKDLFKESHNQEGGLEVDPDQLNIDPDFFQQFEKLMDQLENDANPERTATGA